MSVPDLYTSCDAYDLFTYEEQALKTCSDLSVYAPEVPSLPQELYNCLHKKAVKFNEDYTGDHRVKTWVDAFTDSPKFADLHDKCYLNSSMSASVAMASSLMYHVQMRDMEDSIKKLQEEGVDIDDAASEHAAKIRQTVSGIVDSASEGAEALVVACGLLAGSDNDYHSLDADDAAVNELAQFLLQNPEITAYFEDMGRMVSDAETDKKSRLSEGMSELYEVGRGNSLSRVLPSELCKLTDPTLSSLFFKDFVEGGLLQYELRGNEDDPQTRGPVIMCLDISSSMECHNRIHVAYAALLALHQLCVSEKRSLRVILFNSRVVKDVVTYDGVRANAKDLLKTIGTPVGGGTDFEPPLRKAISYIDSDSREDVIIVTDDHGNISDELAHFIEDEKAKSEFCLYSFFIGGSKGSLGTVSDYTYSFGDDFSSESIRDSKMLSFV